MALSFLAPNETSFQHWSWIATSIGVIITALKALQDWELSRRQHADEFRWKRGELAMKVIDAMYSDQYAKSALTMIDWTNHEYLIAPGKTARIMYHEVARALRPHSPQEFEFTEKEYFIRECFDHLGDHLERIQHLLSIGMIDAEDIWQPLEYWEVRMSDVDTEVKGFRSAIRTFLQSYRFNLALKLLDGLRNPSPPTAPR